LEKLKDFVDKHVRANAPSLSVTPSPTSTATASPSTTRPCVVVKVNAGTCQDGFHVSNLSDQLEDAFSCIFSHNKSYQEEKIAEEIVRQILSQFLGWNSVFKFTEKPQLQSQQQQQDNEDFIVEEFATKTFSQNLKQACSVSFCC